MRVSKFFRFTFINGNTGHVDCIAEYPARVVRKSIRRVFAEINETAGDNCRIKCEYVISRFHGHNRRNPITETAQRFYTPSAAMKFVQ